MARASEGLNTDFAITPEKEGNMTALKDVIIIPINKSNGTVALWMSVTVGGTTMEPILVDIEAGVVNVGGET